MKREAFRTDRGDLSQIRKGTGNLGDKLIFLFDL